MAKVTVKSGIFHSTKRIISSVATATEEVVDLGSDTIKLAKATVRGSVVRTQLEELDESSALQLDLLEAYYTQLEKLTATKPSSVITERRISTIQRLIKLVESVDIERIAQ